LTDERFGEAETAFFDRWNRTTRDSPLMVFNLGRLKPKNADDQYYWGMVFNGTDTECRVAWTLTGATRR